MIKKVLIVFLAAAAFSITAGQLGDSLRIVSVNEIEASPDSMCKVAITYPKIQDLNNTAKQNRINEYLKEKFTTAKQKFNVSDCDSVFNFDVDVSYQIKYNTRPFISLVLNHYEFTGGTHPNYASIGFNIETATGYVYGLGDIFRPETFDTITAMVKNQILKNYDASTLVEAGLYEDTLIITPEQDYYVDNGFIVIQYDPYEIAPYAMGSIEIPLLFDDIWPFIEGDLPFQIIKEK